jgi:hypothetical protein
LKTLEKEIGRVRGFRPDDAPMLAELCRRSVEAAGPIHYSREQVNAWLSVLPSADEILARYSDGRVTVIAVGAADGQWPLPTSKRMGTSSTSTAHLR